MGALFAQGMGALGAVVMCYIGLETAFLTPAFSFPALALAAALLPVAATGALAAGKVSVRGLAAFLAVQVACLVGAAALAVVAFTLDEASLRTDAAAKWESLSVSQRDSFGTPDELASTALTNARNSAAVLLVAGLFGAVALYFAYAVRHAITADLVEVISWKAPPPRVKTDAGDGETLPILPGTVDGARAAAPAAAVSGAWAGAEPADLIAPPANMPQPPARPHWSNSSQFAKAPKPSAAAVNTDVPIPIGNIRGSGASKAI